ncbi:MAG: hypothetical protein GC201_07935 [Alphaproteobacteria bacterium]|nr:hypothetical protein [Alphaproteobacteria bacterium]
MPRVMIECPETHRMIYTGVNLNWNSFEGAKIGEQTVPCPACGAVHRWTRADATIDEVGTAD